MVTVTPVAAVTVAFGVVTVAPVVTVAAVWPQCCVVNSRALGPWGAASLADWGLDMGQQAKEESQL